MHIDPQNDGGNIDKSLHHRACDPTSPRSHTCNHRPESNLNTKTAAFNWLRVGIPCHHHIEEHLSKDTPPGASPQKLRQHLAPWCSATALPRASSPRETELQALNRGCRRIVRAAHLACLRVRDMFTSDRCRIRRVARSMQLKRALPTSSRTTRHAGQKGARS